MTDQGRFSTWMIGCMTKLIDASGQTYQAFDGTFRGELPSCFQETYQTEDQRRQHFHSPAAAKPMIPLSFIFLTKFGSKFSTVVREYVTEPSRLSKSRAELRRESVYKSVEAEEIV
ncbi:hypothetical protein Tco_1087502 [Tanacetum coccineum]